MVNNLAEGRVSKIVRIPQEQQQLLNTMKADYMVSHSYLIRLGIDLAAKHLREAHQNKGVESKALCVSHQT